MFEFYVIGEVDVKIEKYDSDDGIFEIEDLCCDC